MTRDEIIRMAKIAAQGEPISGQLCCELIAEAWTPFFMRFADLVTAAERERWFYSTSDAIPFEVTP